MNCTSVLFVQPVAMFPVMFGMPGVGASFVLLGALLKQRGCVVCSEAQPFCSTQSAPAKKENTFGPRPITSPGTRTVSRCAECGALLQNLSEPLGQCPKCGFDLHACINSAHLK